MEYINGLSTVNCGIIKQFKVYDPIRKEDTITVELLYPEKHNPRAQIVCYYFMDKDTNSKIEITVYKMLDTKIYGSEVYFFKNRSETQHYRSRNYISFAGIPNKYKGIVNSLLKVHKVVYGD